MPLRSNDAFLAGIGILLGTCLAGSGCQSQSIHGGLLATRPEAAASSSMPTEETPPDNVAKPSHKSDGFFNGAIVKMLAPRRMQAAPSATADEATSAWRSQARPGSDTIATSEAAAIQPVQALAPSPAQTAQVPPGELMPVYRPAGEPQPLAVGPVVHAVPPMEMEAPVTPIGLFHPARAMAALPVAREGDKQSLPPYIIEPPDILLIRASRAITLPTQPLDGQHLVKMDGHVNLGIYGEVYLSGRTLEQARDIVAQALLNRRVKGKDPSKLMDKEAKDTDLTLDDIKKELQVDVLAYNSKFYFIIIDGAGFGEKVFRIPFTGNETVLDAFSQIGGIPEVSSKRNMWIARSSAHDGMHPAILPIDWRSVAQCADPKTNYQLYPGDRIYVKADKLLCIDNWLGKVLNPIERGFGATLLGATTINAIKSGSNSGGSQ